MQKIHESRKNIYAYMYVYMYTHIPPLLSDFGLFPLNHWKYKFFWIMFILFYKYTPYCGIFWKYINVCPPN